MVTQHFSTALQGQLEISIDFRLILEGIPAALYEILETSSLIKACEISSTERYERSVFSLENIAYIRVAITIHYNLLFVTGLPRGANCRINLFQPIIY
jgi:hypothetical protein